MKQDGNTAGNRKILNAIPKDVLDDVPEQKKDEFCRGVLLYLSKETPENCLKHFAFRVVKPGDRAIAILFAIQVFTAVSQVALASILGVYHGYGLTSQFIPNYLVTYCKNLIMALPVQLFIAGPAARWIFRLSFEWGEKKE